MGCSVTGQRGGGVAAEDAADLAAGLDGSDDVEEVGWALSQTKESRRGTVREHAALAAGEHGSHQAAVPPGRRVANPKGRAEDRIQPAGGDAVVDRCIADSQPPQLLARDHAVLA